MSNKRHGSRPYDAAYQGQYGTGGSGLEGGQPGFGGDALLARLCVEADDIELQMRDIRNRIKLLERDIADNESGNGILSGAVRTAIGWKLASSMSAVVGVVLLVTVHLISGGLFTLLSVILWVRFLAEKRHNTRTEKRADDEQRRLIEQRQTLLDELDRQRARWFELDKRIKQLRNSR